MIPIARQQIKGLPLIEPYLKLTGHKIPKEIVLSIWSSSVLACDRAANPVEALFHIQFIHQEWKLDMPPQEATLASCRPLLSGAGSSYLAACVECHSHGAMPAFFSSDDNLDEVGLRIYAVLGRIFSEKPEIAVRIGIYGHYMRIPANWVFELPIFISDTEEENG